LKRGPAAKLARPRCPGSDPVDAGLSGDRLTHRPNSRPSRLSRVEPCDQHTATLFVIATTPPPKRHPYDQWSPDARALDLVGDKWTLLIIRDLASGPRRFVEIQRTLPGISTEQLRSRLNRMVADGLLTRQRYREVPPRVDYELTERSRELQPVVGALARWGYDWTWSRPRDGEEVNIGAILRTAPGLLKPPASTRGSVKCVVEAEGDEPERTYVLGAGDGAVTISEQPVDAPDATVRGSVSAWVRALGPGGDLSGLEIGGRRELAEGLLAGFVQAAVSSRAAA
jgi:DNA-binding HxlR family transcriptional regulator